VVSNHKNFMNGSITGLIGLIHYWMIRSPDPVFSAI